jgi:PAS domain S-box-containing protein
LQPSAYISSDDIQAILEAISGLAWSVTSDGSLEFFNQAWQQYTGLPAGPAESWNWTQAVHPDDVARLLDYWNSAEPHGIDARLRGQDGQYGSFRIRRRPVAGASGRIVRWYGTATGTQSHAVEPGAMINTIPTLAWATRPDGWVDFLNQRWLDYTGLSREQALGHGWTVAVHPEDRSGLVSYWQSLIASGRPGQYEARFRRFDGVYRWFLFRAEPSSDPSGRILKWYGTNVEIEDRKQADEAVRASERNLRAIINTIPTLSWSTRPDGYVEFLSARWLGFTGLTEEQALGFGWAVAIYPQDAQRLLEYWQSALESGTDVDVEARLRRFDGVYRWFLFRASPLRDESGEIVKWYGTNVEIEDRKRADEAVRASERNLRAIINTIPTLSWSTRPDGYVEFLSERWLGFTGLTEEQALGFGWAVAIYPQDAQPLLEYWQSALNSGTDVDVEARLRRFDGVYRWFLFRASPLRDESGKIVKWYGTNVDIEDRKQADEALRASERNLRSIINSIPELAWSTAPDGYCDFVNQRWLDFTGCSLEQVLGWGWRPLIHPDDEPGLVKFWQHALNSGEAGEHEARLRRFDGVYRWFLFRPVALRDESGNIVKWYGQNIDIDDRKRAEDAVNRNERTLRSIINTIPVTAWSTRPDGYCDFLNQRWLDYAGMSGEEARGWGWASAVHPDDAANLARYWQSCLDTGTPADTEARMRRFDGTYRWFLFRANPWRDESGQIVSWYGTNIDIEDRKQVTEALRASERDLSLIIETIPGFVWCASPKGEFNYLNQRILDYTGAVLADWGKGGWTRFLHPNDVDPTMQAWSNAVATGRPHEIQCRLRRSDGQYRWFHMLGEAARDGQGAIARWYGLLLDIDDRIRIGETLRSTEARLSRATQIATAGEMSASIAHEINQPLAAVVASGHACRRFLSAEPPNVAGALEAAESIVRDGKDAADVIRRVRALFKRAAVETTMLNVNDVIGEVLRLLAGEIAKRRVSVETELATDLPLVPGDRVQLQQLTSNLLLNGMEAMDSVDDRSRKLSIRSRWKDAGTVLVEITDSGVGLENPEKAFEAFVTTKENGMGMGLTICRSIIEAHQGRLWVASTPGPGATLCFTLPATVGLA